MIQGYRPDIDGLRAIAVIAVVFFHFGFDSLSGGYVGVDVFFVISGYLITSILIREIAGKVFSILGFYERRIRRLLPALSVVVLVSVILGPFLLPPDSVVDLGRSAASTALFISNINFYLETGYFDQTAESKPLLHTWSLAVEEQFYIFFPLLLLLVSRLKGRPYFRVLLTVSLLSLLLCVYWTIAIPSAAFYLIPTRAWELLIGSMVALRIVVFPNYRLLREVGAIVGMLMVLYSIFSFTEEIFFPGMWALVPTLGAALIIITGADGNTAVSKMLSVRPLVFVGLISYSLYLWHWPISVYTNLYFIKEIDVEGRLLLLVATVVISVLSWRFIELPFRKKSLAIGRQSILLIAVFISFSIVAFGEAIVMKEGVILKSLLPQIVEAEDTDNRWDHWGACGDVAERLRVGEKLCSFGEKEDEAKFILWGDSHARAAAPGIDLSSKKYSVSGEIATMNACPPLLSVERQGRTKCNEFNELIVDYIETQDEIETVILAARWALSAKGSRYKKESGDQVKLVYVNTGTDLGVGNAKIFEDGIRETVTRLATMGKKVILVDPVPEVGYDVPTANYVAQMTGRDVEKLIAPSLSEFRERTQEVNVVFASLAKHHLVMRVSAEDVLCMNGACSVTMSGKSLYRDDDHLSVFGSEKISPIFWKIY